MFALFAFAVNYCALAGDSNHRSLKAKLENTSLRLAHKKSAQTRRRTRVSTSQAALPDDAPHRAHNSVHAISQRDSNFTKGLLQSGYRGPGAFVTEKRQAFVHYDVDPAERALLARDYRPQGEFSQFLNRCISQCYEKRRGIEDPGGRVVAISSAAFATAAPSRPKPGQKSKYIGLQLAPVVPERYGSTATIGVHNNAQWQGVHPKPMNLAFVNDYKRQKEREKLKGFLNSTTTTRHKK